MSTNKERLTKGLKDFVNQHMVMGAEYWMDRGDFETAFEQYLQEEGIIITWLLPIKCDRDVLDVAHSPRYPDPVVSFTGELMRMYPDIKREKRGFYAGLAGIAVKKKKGRTVGHFIKERLEYGDDLRVSNEALKIGIDRFRDIEIDDERLSINKIYKMIEKAAGKHGVEISHVMYYSDGKARRGIQGVGVKG